MISVKLPDGGVRELAPGASSYDLASAIGPGLARAAVAAKVDGTIVDLSRPLFVEGESRKIGRIALPQPLVDRLRASDCIEIDATAEARLAYLLRDYGYVGTDPAALSRQLALLTELHGKIVVGQWQQWAEQGNLAPLVQQLIALHYDPAYARSQSTNFSRWGMRKTLVTDDLSDEAIGRLAGEVAAVAMAATPASTTATAATTT